MLRYQRAHMGPSCLLFTLVCLTQLVRPNDGQGFYSIIAPNTLRPNSIYHVAVSLHKSAEAARVKLGILGTSFSDFKTVEINPFATELVQFELPALKKDRYRLTVMGLSGVQFTNETLLHFKSKQFTVMLQTDKAIYRPGDLVRYRVLVLGPNLKSVRDYGRVHIEIKDAGHNVIKRYEDVKLSNGVYSNELQLADYPTMGEWSINVEAMEEHYRRSFEVVEYILPKFVVDIESEKHIIYKNNKIKATIKAYYPFGKAIKGEATLSIYPTFYGSLQPFVNDLITRQVAAIDGQAYFEFDIQNELKLKEEYEREYLLDALVEEKSTGSVQNFSTIITVHLDPFRIETVAIPTYYIPGVPFEVTARLVRNDGLPLEDFTSIVTAYLTNVYGSSEMYDKTAYTFDSKGEVNMQFTVPPYDKDEYHSVIVEYKGIITEVGKVPQKHLHSTRYITAKVMDAKPTVNKDVNISVHSSETMQYFMYQIVGRGDILLSRSVSVPNSTFHTIKFLATSAMAPRAKLLVYMVIDGEFVYDEQVIRFDDNFIGSVQIYAPIKAPPGQDIEITIATKPYSYIGLMIVDQNAANIRTGNDFTQDDLVDELNSYELQDTNTAIGSPGKLSGVVTMSNADYFIEKEPETTPILDSDMPSEDEDKLTTIRKTDIGPAHRFEVNTLSPGKGRYAFSYTPKPYWHNPRIHVMHDPADTWLFMNVTTGADGRTTIHRRIPSAMTSWVLTAFSLDPVSGFAVTKSKQILQSYRDVYVTTQLPYSIKTGEVIAIPFVVFNNKDSDLDVEVTFYNTNQDFEFVQLNNNGRPPKKVELYSRRVIKVLGKTSKSTSFIVTPNIVGPINVKAVIAADGNSDTVESTLLVEHPGATEVVNRGFLFDMSSRAMYEENINISVPRNAIPDSTTIEVSAVGDVLGSIFGDYDSLINLPTGCGEQTMVTFMPNLMVLKYLRRRKELKPSVEMRAKMHLDLGYQSLLHYRHANGAFSAFGLSEQNSSTWLTAYVARGFREASKYVQIDEHVISSALEYMVSTQAADGGFKEKGDIFEQFNDDGISLTAFATLALIENEKLYPDYKNNINKAVNFIASKLDTSKELHAMAIGTYVLSRANHNAKGAFLQRMDALAINEDGKKWWNKTAPQAEGPSPWYHHKRSVNIEISAYAALAILENNLIGDAMPVLKWLVDQRNQFGGFVASQDTVVGLQALMAFGERFSTQANNLRIAVNYGQGAVTSFNVVSDNSLTIQRYELPNTLRNLSLIATGTGMALGQVSYKYNTNVTGAWPRFVLDPTVNRNSHADYLHLSACARFVPVEGGANHSNMAVMEVYLPSGFVVDTDTLPTLESSERIKKVETKRHNTVVVIYFDYLDKREVCPTLHAYKTVKVAKHKPVPVIMYDYYDNVRRARQFYRAPKSHICDICEDNNCGSLCEKAEKRLDGRSLDGAGTSQQLVFSLTTLLLAMVMRLLI